MVAVPAYIKDFTEPQMASKTIDRCDVPGKKGDWNGKNIKNTNYIKSDQGHDEISHKSKSLEATDHKHDGNCSGLDIESIMIRSALQMTAASVIKHLIYDLEKPMKKKKGVAATATFAPHNDPASTGWQFQPDKVPSKLDNCVKWVPTAVSVHSQYGNALKETYAVDKVANKGKRPGLYKMAFCQGNVTGGVPKESKMGSAIFSNYMLKVWDKYTDEDKLYFHTITDCGPYLSTVVATTSNDFDSGSTPSQIGYFMEEVEAAETTDDNIHTIGLAYIARDISKHRALAQHMMIRILGDIQVSGDYICEAIFGAKVPPALRTWFGQQPHDIKKQLTNQQVCDIQKDVVDHVNLTGESDAENKFLLQDLYANWIWQLTLIHIFNVKYGVDNNNIGGTDVTTTHDAAAAAGDGAAGVLQVEEKKASLAMFFRLSQFSFYMGHLVNTRVLKCKVQNSGEWDDHSSRAPKDPANLNDCYQNVVNLFYRDFWKPLFDSQVIATSRLWLEHAESKGWCEFTTAQPGVAGFLRDAFRQGAPKATSGTAKTYFEGFAKMQLGNVSIHNPPTSHPHTDDKYKDGMNAALCRVGSDPPPSWLPDCNPRPPNKPTAVFPSDVFPWTNPAKQKLPAQFYLDKKQFTTGLLPSAADIIMEQRIQLDTNQMLKTIGDQSHLQDFKTKSKYLNDKSIRPILQIQDRPLDGLSLRYLDLKESKGIVICEGASIFINSYSHTLSQGSHYEVKRVRKGTLAANVTDEHKHYGHKLEEIDTSAVQTTAYESLSRKNCNLIAWTDTAAHPSLSNKIIEKISPYLPDQVTYPQAVFTIGVAAIFVGLSISNIFSGMGGGGVSNAKKKNNVKQKGGGEGKGWESEAAVFHQCIKTIQTLLLAKKYVPPWGEEPELSAPLDEHIKFYINIHNNPLFKYYRARKASAADEADEAEVALDLMKSKIHLLSVEHIENKKSKIFEQYTHICDLYICYINVKAKAMVNMKIDSIHEQLTELDKLYKKWILSHLSTVVEEEEVAGDVDAISAAAATAGARGVGGDVDASASEAAVRAANVVAARWGKIAYEAAYEAAYKAAIQEVNESKSIDQSAALKAASEAYQNAYQKAYQAYQKAYQAAIPSLGEGMEEDMVQGEEVSISSNL